MGYLLQQKVMTLNDKNIEYRSNVRLLFALLTFLLYKLRDFAKFMQTNLVNLK